MEINAAMIEAVQVAAPPPPVPLPPGPAPAERKKKQHRPETLRVYYCGGLQIASLMRYHDTNGGSLISLKWPEGSLPVPSIEAGDALLMERLKSVPRPTPEGVPDTKPAGFRVYFHVEPGVVVAPIPEEQDHEHD